ncbi:hypothetical protein [Streptomyces sp. SID14515]|uniref:hypothetical protein n=1 Tax=Streptomyces sp. SID14515 TaxID=2706074 RepID=UPI0013C5D1F3|nr:hypothetical protein [Streptomyces sp. SID14515]NEB36562.1 hypothetical protein [Streptomyces sp. SID14515]
MPHGEEGRRLTTAVACAVMLIGSAAGATGAVAAAPAQPSVVDLGAVDHEGSRHPGSNVRGTAEVLHWFR